MRCTQLFDGAGTAEVGARRVLFEGFAVLEDDLEVDDVDDVDELLGIRDVEVAAVPIGDDGVGPPASVPPPEEHPARTNPEMTQPLTARTNWREAGTARR